MNWYGRTSLTRTVRLTRRMHLIVNPAFGDTRGGGMGIDEGCLPARLEVEYIRVYRSPESMALPGQQRVK